MKYFLSLILLFFINCNSKDELERKPNVILIMADEYRKLINSFTIYRWAPVNTK